MERNDIIGYQPKALAEKPAWLRQRLEWFQDQKFGIILHWAPYALWDCCESWPLSPGDPWARSEDMECWTSRNRDLKTFQRDYWDLNRQFNPTRFDAKEWARLCKQAGARYLAFTTKHHDGFCMWDSGTTEYKVTGSDCPFHTDSRADIFGEICRAFQGEGLGISAYFSKADWHSPHYWSPKKTVETRGANTLEVPADWAQFVSYTHHQIRELMSNYGKIDILWLDAGWVKDAEDIDMPGLAAMARSLQPDLIIANRTVGDDYEDFVTPEREIPGEPLESPWESCLVMAENWKYHPRDKYRPVAEILEMLVDTISKGGNMLLGIGPTPDGEFPPEAIDRLEAIGHWMAINGEAVYGTRAIKPYLENGIRFTQRSGKAYAFCSNPEEILITSFRPKEARLLGTDLPVQVNQTSEGTRLSVLTQELPKPWVFEFSL